MKYTVVGRYPDLDSNGGFVDHVEADTVQQAVRQVRSDRDNEYVTIEAVFAGYLLDLYIGD